MFLRSQGTSHNSSDCSRLFVWPFHKVTIYTAHVAHTLILQYDNQMLRKGFTHPLPYTMQKWKRKSGEEREGIRSRKGRERRKQEGSLLILEACAITLAVRGRWPNQTIGVTMVSVCPYVQKLLSMSSAVGNLPVHNPKLTVASSAS